MKNQAMKSRYWVPMVGHAFHALEAIGDADKELSLQEISERAGITKSSTYRILFTLEALGYIGKNAETGKYQLGLKVLESAQKVRAGLSILQAARPLMESLQRKFGETVNLAVLQNNQIVYLEIIEGSHAFRMTGEVGARVPAYASAIGKAISAFLPEAALKALLDGEPLRRLTPNTITSRAELHKSLARVRRQGYALDNEEVDLGASCIAVPIFTDGSRATHAVSLSGPTARIKTQQKAMITELLKFSKEASNQLQL
jgi:IclR family acetate operon transcriptional repressor